MPLHPKTKNLSWWARFDKIFYARAFFIAADIALVVTGLATGTLIVMSVPFLLAALPAVVLGGLLVAEIWDNNHRASTHKELAKQAIRIAALEGGCQIEMK